MSGTPVLPPAVVRQWLRTVTAFPNAVTGFGMVRWLMTEIGNV